MKKKKNVKKEKSKLMPELMYLVALDRKMTKALKERKPYSKSS